MRGALSANRYLMSLGCMPGLLGSAGISKRVRKAVNLTEVLEEVMIPFLKRIEYVPTDPRN